MTPVAASAAAFWTSSLGFSDLNQFFSSQGINTEGGAVVAASAVSGDGRTMAGNLISRFGYVPFALKIPTVLVCHAQETTTVSFPQGMDAALLQGDTLGPCQCNTAAPEGIATLSVSKSAFPTAQVSWSEVSGATGYDVVRGSLDALRSSGGNFGTAVNACRSTPRSASADRTR